MKKFNEIIKNLREQHKYTQKFVAEYLKIDRSNYSKYELGKLEPNLEMLRALCKLYDISADYLLGITSV